LLVPYPEPEQDMINLERIMTGNIFPVYLVVYLEKKK